MTVPDSLKKKVLRAIIESFERWSAPFPRVCAAGCSSCCTQNVLITALEGRQILDFICENEREQRCADRLWQVPGTAPSPLTTNEFAAACLQQQDVEDPGDPPSVSACLFLERDLCTIYEVRPFACRCFVSEKTCAAEKTAVQKEIYMAAATAMMQLIEHLGRDDRWGPMPDVLATLCRSRRYRLIADHHAAPGVMVAAGQRTRRARALPGFLIPSDDWRRISLLLEDIFSTVIDGQNIADILNLAPIGSPD